MLAGGKEAKAIPATINEMLLRGCLLKNTGHILGLVVYTGKESRIQMNAAKTPLKVGGCTASPSSRDLQFSQTSMNICQVQMLMWHRKGAC